VSEILGLGLGLEVGLASYRLGHGLGHGPGLDDFRISGIELQLGPGERVLGLGLGTGTLHYISAFRWCNVLTRVRLGEPVYITAVNN